MSSDSSGASRYALSFTTGGLFANEAAVVVPVYFRTRDWDVARAEVRDANLLQRRVASSATRVTRALIPRLQLLSEPELRIVEDGTSTERGHIMWAAACRRYDLIAEFAEEVLRERFLTLATTLTYDAFDSFFRAKAMWHHELDEVTVLTYKKLRQVVFRMMLEAGLRGAPDTIEPALFSSRVADELAARQPSDFRFFPTRVA